MKGQELKIIFRKDKAYLTADRSMTFEQLGLPDSAKKTFEESAFWTIKVLNHRENEKKIFCEISSYQNGEAVFGSSQKRLADKLNDLEIVTFKSIDTTGLLKTLAGNSGVKRPIKSVPVDRTPIQPTEFVRQPHKVSIKETFYVPLKNVRFKLGGVSFDKKFKEHKKTLELTIPNYDIREEFDAVKNYFANVLKTKKIEVTVNIGITDNQVTSIDIVKYFIVLFISFSHLCCTTFSIWLVSMRYIHYWHQYFFYFIY
jgi:hypothetical protein